MQHPWYQNYSAVNETNVSNWPFSLGDNSLWGPNTCNTDMSQDRYFSPVTALKNRCQSWDFFMCWWHQSLIKLLRLQAGACFLCLDSDSTSGVWEWHALHDKLHMCHTASGRNDPLRPSIICPVGFHFSWFIGPALKLMCVTYINPFSKWLTDASRFEWSSHT